MPATATNQIYQTRTRRGAARCCVDLLSDYMHTTTERIRRTTLAEEKCHKTILIRLPFGLFWAVFGVFHVDFRQIEARISALPL